MVSSKKWNRGGRRGEGSESSCWKQSWLGEGFLIPLLHTGNAGAVSVSGAVPQKTKYLTASWVLHIVLSPWSRIPSAGAGIYTTGGAASSTYLAAARPPGRLMPQIWEPTENLVMWAFGFGFRGLPSSSLRDVQGTLSERQIRRSTTVTTFDSKPKRSLLRNPQRLWGSDQGIVVACFFPEA